MEVIRVVLKVNLNNSNESYKLINHNSPDNPTNRPDRNSVDTATSRWLANNPSSLTTAALTAFIT